MSWAELIVAHFAIFVVVLAMASCAAFDFEFWPFSNFAMYSHLQETEFSYLALFGVLAEGATTQEQEIRLNKKTFLTPFDDRAAMESIGKILKVRGTPAVAAPLALWFSRYESLREKSPDLKKLAGLRLYKLTWLLGENKSILQDPQSKTLLFEYRP
jgi:hypothetical protein